MRTQKCHLTHDISVHSHDFSELVVVLGGRAVHIIEGREIPVTAGQAFFIHGNVSHGYKNVNNIQYINVMLHPDQIARLPEMKLLPGFPFKGMLTLSQEQLERITGLLDLILEEQSKKPEGYQLLIRTYFIAVIGMLSRYYVSNSGWSDNQTMRITESITYLEEYYLEPVTLQELAERAYLSKRQFLREFAQNFHTTPIDYVIRRRLEYSCTLLWNESLSIQQVAQESGFREQSYYARQFRKVYQCTPKEYRKKHMNHAGNEC